MAKVIEFKAPKHIYEVDNCSGCGAEIVDEYTELKLPTQDGFKYIALCDECENEAIKNGFK